jgi:hypothetical protein
VSGDRCTITLVAEIVKHFDGDFSQRESASFTPKRPLEAMSSLAGIDTYYRERTILYSVKER